MTRPLLQKGIVDLEKLFTSAESDAAMLNALANELRYRQVPRATALSDRVQAALNSTKIQAGSYREPVAAPSISAPLIRSPDFSGDRLSSPSLSDHHANIPEPVRWTRLRVPAQPVEAAVQVCTKNSGAAANSLTITSNALSVLASGAPAQPAAIQVHTKKPSHVANSPIIKTIDAALALPALVSNVPAQPVAIQVHTKKSSDAANSSAIKMAGVAPALPAFARSVPAQQAPVQVHTKKLSDASHSRVPKASGAVLGSLTMPPRMPEQLVKAAPAVPVHAKKTTDVLDMPKIQATSGLSTAPVMSIEVAYKYLKITSGATWESIEQNRRQVVQLAHPERVALLSADQRMQAQTGAHQANAAYLLLSILRTNQIV